MTGTILSSLPRILNINHKDLSWRPKQHTGPEGILRMSKGRVLQMVRVDRPFVELRVREMCENDELLSRWVTLLFDLAFC